MDATDDPSVHRLEASAPSTGGLVIKNKSAASTTFKVPQPSLLGLDRLAAQKRKERDEANRLISFKESEYDDVGGTPNRPDGTPKRTPDESSVHKINRQYREAQDETPSHTGGVSDKARHRIAERSEKDRRGIAYSSKDRKRSRRDDEDDRRSARRDHRDRYDRDRNRDGRSDRSDHRHRSRTDSERSLHTPRIKDEPRTPRSGRSFSTSLASWDDDDDRPSTSKKSSWDFTPKHGERHSDWSARSSKHRSAKYADDTPRPTPAHKFNAWANDRKRSGATPQIGRYINILMV